jgi:uncharacterized repeat protein (TIGR03803 family)
LNTKGVATVLYTFPGPADGQYPYNVAVAFSPDGGLYGATFYGGPEGSGVVYQLDGQGNDTVLHSFSLFTPNDYGQPIGNLVRDSAGDFYGTTYIGQAEAGYGYGVVYKLDTAGNARVVHNFTNGPDGGNPYGGVIIDSKGNLYGTASGGGASGAGVVFKIASGNETTLYNFTGGADGGTPLGNLIFDSAGNLYGTFRQRDGVVQLHRWLRWSLSAGWCNPRLPRQSLRDYQQWRQVERRRGVQDRSVRS